MKQTIFILIFAGFCSCYGNAQAIYNAGIIDSLKKQIRYIHEDTSGIRVINALAESYQNSSNDSCLKYANIALSLSDKLLSTDLVKNNPAYTNTCKLLKARAIENIAATLEQTKTKTALEFYEKALNLEAETGNKIATAHTYEWIGNMYTTLSKFDEAEKNLQLSLNLCREAGDKNQLANTLLSIAILFQYKNKLDEAIKYFDSSLNMFSEAGDRKRMANTYFTLGGVYYAAGDYNEAIKNYELSLNLCKKTGDKYLMGDCYQWIGGCQRILGHYGDGIESELNALQIGQEVKDTSLITSAYNEMSYIHASIKDYNEALKNLKAELNLYKLRNDSSGIASAYNDIAYINIEKGDYDAALKYYGLGLAVLKKSNNYYNLFNAFSGLAELYERQGKYREAIENGKAEIQYAQLYGNRKFITIAYFRVADIYMKASDAENALKYYQESLKMSSESGLNKQGAFASLGIAKITLSQGKTAQAIAWLKKAATLTPRTEYILLRDINQKLSEAYEKRRDFKNAFLSQVKFKQFSDSVTSKEKAEKLASLTNQLEFENKRALQKASQEKTIALRDSEIGRQKLVRNVSLAGLGIFIVFAGIFFMRFLEKRKLNIALEKTLINLKNAQSQLIQQEKLASLGELTAGIAHEIQNPLNFVNNFSEVNTELIDEMKNELAAGNQKEVMAIANSIRENELKINSHGKRADAIVKGMLQHSRESKGQKELTDINALADEYLRLSYQGVRAKDRTFNTSLVTDFDPGVGKINMISQDIGRVLLNLYNNAFYVVTEKKKSQAGEFEPKVSLSTKKMIDKVEIRVKDNGRGIPQNILEKIFQPFFTTKPAGQGTGLGLSLSYDIIKAHGGTIRVETKDEVGAEFIIELPC